MWGSVEGRDLPIAYFSQCFTGAALRYSVVEKEFYTVVLALKHWKHFERGHTVHVYSDQQSISWGIKQTGSRRLMNWMTLISYFDVQFFYHPGRHNRPADFLSRMWKEHTIQCVYEMQPMTKSAFQWPKDVRENTMRETRRRDPMVKQLIDLLQGRIVKNPMVEAKKLAKTCMYNEFSGCVYAYSGINYALLVPESLKKMILQEAHDSSTGEHQGITKTLGKIGQRFWWPGIHEDVTRYVNSCPGCATRKYPTHPVMEPLRPVVASTPWNSMVIDILGPLPTSFRQNRYILVCMDRFTKWPECLALRNIWAEIVARAFIGMVITRDGVPLECQSDQGTQFTSSLFQEVSRVRGMKDTFSAAYEPQA